MKYSIGYVTFFLKLFCGYFYNSLSFHVKFSCNGQKHITCYDRVGCFFFGRCIFVCVRVCVSWIKQERVDARSSTLVG